MLLTLKRLGQGTEGTFGALLDSDIPFAVTLEPEVQRLSGAIPPGIYQCRKTMYHAGQYMTYEVCDVPNRTRILFHKGNIAADTMGCVLIGEEFGTLNGKPAILASGRGFAEFMNKLEGQGEFWLEVKA